MSTRVVVVSSRPTPAIGLTNSLFFLHSLRLPQRKRLNVFENLLESDRYHPIPCSGTLVLDGYNVVFHVVLRNAPVFELLSTYKL